MTGSRFHYMKNILLLLSMVITISATAQTPLYKENPLYRDVKHGLETGIDTIAQNHAIHEKITYNIWFTDSIPDTTSVMIHTYNKLGQIVQFEKYGYTGQYFRKHESPWRLINFEYNEEGYLISERISKWPTYITAPVHEIDTLYQKKTETYRIGYKMNLIDRETIQKTDKEGNIRYKSYTNFYYSDQDQLILEDMTTIYPGKEPRKSQSKYTYSEKGLLTSSTWQWQGIDGEFYKHLDVYEYVFYD